MATPTLRRIDGLAFRENDTTEVAIPRGFLEAELRLSLVYTATLTVAGTAVKPRGTPIRRVQLVTDGGRVLQSFRPESVIKELEVFEQTALAAINSPPTGFGVGANAGAVDLVIPFRSMHANDPMLTALPTWVYESVILRIEWGTVADVFVGGAVAGTFTAAVVSLSAAGVDDDFTALGDPYAWGRQLLRLNRTYVERPAPAAAQLEYAFELPRTAAIRAVMIETLDANGLGVNTILNAVTLEVNGQLRPVARMFARQIQAGNAKTYGVAMPAGLYVIDFAEDRDTLDILMATDFTTLVALLDVTAIAGTIRMHLIRHEPSLAAAA